MERFLETGAYDVYASPVLMKKGRQGQLISVLCDESLISSVETLFFEETTTIGVRKYPVERNELERHTEYFTFSLGTVKIKKSYFQGKLVNVKPEYNDIIHISRSSGIPAKKVVSIFRSEFTT